MFSVNLIFSTTFTMRAALRLLADVKSVPSQVLESGAPTGLTGLYTHPSPRSTLLYLYNQTLQKLQHFPDYSVYRQSAEALTKHRQSIIEEIKPAGLSEWAERARKKIAENPKAFRGATQIGDSTYYHTSTEEVPEDQEWDGEKGVPTLEGTRDEKEGAFNARAAAKSIPTREQVVDWEPEPPLSAEQIDEAEQKVSAGLIEEVIQVAEGELKLVDTLLESKVYVLFLH